MKMITFFPLKLCHVPTEMLKLSYPHIRPIATRFTVKSLSRKYTVKNSTGKLRRGIIGNTYNFI